MPKIKLSKIFFIAAICLLLASLVLVWLANSIRFERGGSADLPIEQKDSVRFAVSPIYGFKATTAFGGTTENEKQEMITLLNQIGFRFLEFKVRWDEIEPTDDHFQLAELKKFTSDLAKNNIKPILMIKTGASSWATDQTNKKGAQCEKIADLDHPDREYSFAPKSLAEYQEFIQTVVRSLSSDVRDYLIENEAGSCGFFYGSAKDYAEILKTAHTTIHKECANCRVGISNIGFKSEKQKSKKQKAAGKFWLDDIFALGDEKDFDFYSNHCNSGEGKYESADVRGSEELNLCDLAKLQSEFIELKKLDKDVIITESGVLPKDETRERIKRNLYAAFYGQTQMIGSLNFKDLKENQEIQKNWQFLIQEFSDLESIKNRGQDGKYEHFKIYRRDQKPLEVLWTDNDQITINLSNQNFSQLSPNRPVKTISGQNLSLTSEPLILEAD